jgi:Bacterial protein of unknown function (DUF882)
MGHARQRLRLALQIVRRLLFVISLTGSAANAARAQTMAAPLPPIRPFDLQLPEGSQPLRPVQSEVPRQGAAVLTAAPLPQRRPTSGLKLAPVTEEDEAEELAVKPEVTPRLLPGQTPRPNAPQNASLAPTPEWPRLLPGQAEQNTPVISDEHLERRGLTTDPGTSIKCLPAPLRSVLNQVISRYGAVHVTSTWRPGWRARRGSYHRKCEAVDFRVEGISPREALRFVATLPETGGRKVYWNGLLHVDTGPVRSW